MKPKKIVTPEEKTARNTEQSRKRRERKYAERDKAMYVIEEQLRKGNEIYEALKERLKKYDEYFGNMKEYESYKKNLDFYIKNVGSSLKYFGVSHYTYVLEQAFYYMKGAAEEFQRCKNELLPIKANAEKNMGE